MSVSIEIFSKVSEYLQHRITLWDLESWLVPRLPLYLDNPDSASGQLAGLIELCLSELQAGIRTERSIRKLLSQHTEPKPVLWIQYPDQGDQAITTSATPVTEAMDWAWPDLSPAWSNGVQVADG